MVVGLGSLAVVLVLRRFARVVPAPLVAVLAAIVAVHVFGLHKHGVEIVGPIGGGLPAFGPFFANADHVQAAIQDAAKDGIQAVVLDCETMPSIDVTAARMLTQLAADLQRHGVRLVLAGEIGQVRDMLAAVGGPDGSPEYHRTVPEAVASARDRPGTAGQPGQARDRPT